MNKKLLHNVAIVGNLVKVCRVNNAYVGIDVGIGNEIWGDTLVVLHLVGIYQFRVLRCLIAIGVELVKVVSTYRASVEEDEVVEGIAKELGGSIKLVKYVRFEKGEGLEKKVDDFAAEVASMAK